MKKILFSICMFLFLQCSAIDFYGVYPTNWWVGMKDNKLQLMMHGEKIGLFEKVSIKYPGISIAKIHKVESNNYLF
ncbi:MAG: cyclomaltodextrinase N-terminal domain-containing protein, partial [Bacteroidia bacterium]|nr:cyclomaltodextrinase N-terminal domain-containing protein [Bacteroidia bacterium]